MVVFSRSARDLLATWRATLAGALPAIITYLLIPFTTALFTHWIAAFGSHAVAAFGFAARFESFVVMGPSAIGAGLGPFVGHHWGAGKRVELQYATAWCTRMARRWGIGAALVLTALALPLGRVLADQAELAWKISLALCNLPAGFASYGAILLAGSVYNNIGQASRGTGFARPPPQPQRRAMRWLRHPQTIEPGSAMPDLGVSERDARDMAAYLYTLNTAP